LNKLEKISAGVVIKKGMSMAYSDAGTALRATYFVRKGARWARGVPYTTSEYFPLNVSRIK
jgi:hypothetical protein